MFKTHVLIKLQGFTLEEKNCIGKLSRPPGEFDKNKVWRDGHARLVQVSSIKEAKLQNAKEAGPTRAGWRCAFNPLAVFI